jgi:predicted RNA binding protein YcfA (HicA-like mRNA interferase family)
MKRRDLLQYLNQQGCQLVREGGSHSIWENCSTHKRTAIPRHRKLPNFTVIKICKQLEIPEPFV